MTAGSDDPAARPGRRSDAPLLRRFLGLKETRLLRRPLPRDKAFLLRRVLGAPMRRDLHRLGVLFGTDKATRHGYLPLYQRHLHPLRRQPIVLLEVGIGGYDVTGGGKSLGMWQSYFPRGAVHGLDLHPKTVPGPRITVHRGSQADRDYLEGLAHEVGPFDVIIDDGSHIGRHITISFDVLFPHVKPGGWYIVEDMETAYVPSFEGGPPGTDTTSVQLAKDLIDSVNRAHFDDPDTVTWDVDEIHVYDQLAFFRKAG